MNSYIFLNFSPANLYHLTAFSVNLNSFHCLDIVSKLESDMVSTTSRNTRLKTTLQEKKNKDPNIGVFTDTSGHVSDTLHLD